MLERFLHVCVMALVFTTLSVAIPGIQSPVMAQEEGDSVSDSDSDSDGDGEITGSLDEDLQEFWAERRDVRVVQRRLFEKVGRHQITLYAGLIPNNPFLDYFPVGLRYGYYLLESLGIEIDGSYIGETFTLYGELESFLEERNVNADVLDLNQWRAHLGVNWSPFYGKIAILGLKLVHFDFYLSAGFGAVNVRTPDPNRLGTTDYINPEGSLGAGFNFYINQLFGVRIDFRQFLFEKTGGGVSHPSELSLGFNVLLGGN
jgi:outer membrane beta-barrel protein